MTSLANSFPTRSAMTSTAPDDLNPDDLRAADELREWNVPLGICLWMSCAASRVQLSVSH